VGRTKSRLKGALLELIDQRGYERVTIEQVAERADIGRSTFYSHYAPVWSGGGWTAETP
jgi:AcrR family transcriptional regulator